MSKTEIDLKKLTREQLEVQLEIAQQKLNSIPSELGYWTEKIGTSARVVRRDFREFYGQFLGFTVEVKEVEVGVVDVKHDYSTNTMFQETKIIRIPINSLVDIEWIISQEEKKEEPLQAPATNISK